MFSMVRYSMVIGHHHTIIIITVIVCWAGDVLFSRWFEPAVSRSHPNIGMVIAIPLSSLLSTSLSSSSSSSSSQSSLCTYSWPSSESPADIYVTRQVPIHDICHFWYRGNLVDLVLCVLLGHQNSKIANSMKLVNFAFFSSQYHVFELKNIRGNLIAPNSNQWSLSNENAMSQEDNRKMISLFGQKKVFFFIPDCWKTWYNLANCWQQYVWIDLRSESH